MTHLSDEQLVEQYYSDSDILAAREHLGACEECRARLNQLSAVLRSVEYPVPQLSTDYGANVWRNLKGLLPEAEVRRPWWKLPSTMRWASLGAVGALILAAF